MGCSQMMVWLGPLLQGMSPSEAQVSHDDGVVFDALKICLNLDDELQSSLSPLRQDKSIPNSKGPLQ